MTNKANQRLTENELKKKRFKRKQRKSSKRRDKKGERQVKTTADEKTK